MGYIHRRLANVDLYLSEVAGMFEEIFVTANQLQLTFFYLFGAYKLFSKRLVGIKYLRVSYQAMNYQPNPYKILGWLILMQLGIRYFSKIWRKFRGKKTLDVTVCGSNRPLSNKEPETSKTLVCSLCLENCTGPTTPPCGHLFCWKCIVSWVNDKMKCPVCRSPVLPRQLVALQNFELE